MSQVDTEEVARLQRALSRVCLADSPAAQDLEALGGEAHLVYRRMVRYRIEDLHASALPLTLQTIGRAQLDAWVGAFLADRGPQTRFFREVPVAFAAWADTRVRSDRPSHTRDALRLDTLRWQARWLWAPEQDAELVPFELERVPVAHPTLRRLDVSHGVHQTPSESGDLAWPVRANFCLCVHRRADQKVETRWMDEVGGQLVDGWLLGQEPAITTVQRVLEQRGEAADAAFVDRMTSLLTGLLESGALLGSRA